MNLKDSLKVDDWSDLGSYLLNQIKIEDIDLQVVFCKKQKMFLVNVDQFLLYTNDLNSCKKPLPQEIKTNVVKISEVNSRQRFMPLSLMSKTYCRTQSNGYIRLDNDFKEIRSRVDLVTEYFADMPIMNIKAAKPINKNTFNFKSFKIEYSQSETGLYFRFVDISKALGYKSTPYDTFNEVLSYQHIGGEEVRAISFKNLFLILDKIKGAKKDRVRELITKATSVFFKKKKAGLMVDNKNEIVILDTSAIPYKREFGSILFQTRNLMYHLGYKGEGGFKGKAKDLSEYFEDETCYYIDIEMLPELRDSFNNPEYKENLTKFIKLTNKFKK